MDSPTKPSRNPESWNTNQYPCQLVLVKVKYPDIFDKVGNVRVNGADIPIAIP